MTFVKHVKMTAWGIGIVLEERGGMQTVMFADGQKRTFKTALAAQLLVAAEPATEEERQSLLRARASGGVAPPTAVNLALEAQLAAGFDDPGPFVVYADWMQQHGDPRGDLIHAQARREAAVDATAARKAATVEQKLMREHADVFLPEAFRRKGDFTLTWRLGFIAAIEIGRLDAPERLAQLLAHPSAQYCQELVLTAGIYEPSPIDAIARSRPANLARLVIGAPFAETNTFAAGDLTGLFTLPGLVELSVTAELLAVRAPIVHPRLQRLALRFRRELATFDHVATPDAPALVHLELDCLYGFDGPPIAAFARCHALTTLIVRHTTQTRAWLQRIYASPICARLERLALSDGDLDDAAIPELLANRAKFPRLVAIDLGNNHLSAEGERLLADFAPEVRARGLPVRERRAGPIRDAVIATPAARELAVVARWDVIGYDRARDRAWGEYRGSRGVYAVYAERIGAAGCSCPSFERPCKHATALRLMLAENVALPERAPTSDGFYDRASRGRGSSRPASERHETLRGMNRLLLVVAHVALVASCHHEKKPVCYDCGGPMTDPGPPPCTAQTIASCTVKRQILSQGRDTGYETATFSHGTIKTTLHILENGRGPHVEATLVLAPDGTLHELVAEGHHTMGTKVAETFSRDGAHARWHSEEESGEVGDLSGPAMFWPQADLFEVLPVLVQSAIAAGGTMRLLPSGEAHVARVAALTISANGETRDVIGYAITGLDFVPSYTWMNADGTWFGNVEPSFSVVPVGWATAIAPLVAKQEELRRTRERDLATAQTHRPPSTGLAYTHARVLDVEHGTWLVDQTVVVVGGTIAAVGKAAKIPAGAEVVDLAGKAIIPGLVDMHAHLGDADGVLNIASGVTTVRDVGNDPDKLDDLKARWDAGTAIGPHVFRMGFVEGRNEKAASSKVTAETPDEARAAVKFYADRHYDGMKIYNSIRAELIPIITSEAHQRGMTVTGHIPVHVLANEAVRAGYDGIEHINMLFLNFFATHDTDTRDTTRFTLVGERAADLDLASAPVTEFIALLKEHHTVIDPTLGAFEDLFPGVPGKITPGLESTVARMPVTIARGYLVNGLPLGAEKHALYLRSWAKLFAMVKLLHERGIVVVAGTDSIAGLMLQHELALFVQAGITPADALRMATLDADRALGRSTAGTIAAGQVADLVVVDGDPVARIEDVTHVVSTMKAGVVYPAAPLFAAVGVK